ncbi:MAG: DUF6647 family protein [Alphaproteobacteria bacterium]
MKILKLATVAVMGIGLTINGGARADVPDGTAIDRAMVQDLQKWVERETGYHMPNQPAVVASQEKFQLVMNMKGVHYADARAMYIPGMVILDNETWEQDDPIQVSLLVHELVHHAQLFSKRKYPCDDAREYEAYTIQNKWLEEKGEHPFASQAWIDRMSRCEGNGSSD